MICLIVCCPSIITRTNYTSTVYRHTFTYIFCPHWVFAREFQMKLLHLELLISETSNIAWPSFQHLPMKHSFNEKSFTSWDHIITLTPNSKLWANVVQVEGNNHFPFNRTYITFNDNFGSCIRQPILGYMISTSQIKIKHMFFKYYSITSLFPKFWHGCFITFHSFQ